MTTTITLIIINNVIVQERVASKKQKLNIVYGESEKQRSLPLPLQNMRKKK